MRIFIDGNRTFDLDDDDLAQLADSTVGDSADAVAVALAVNGRAFAWKADGVVLDRADDFPDAGDVELLELVDVSTPADPPADTDAEVETVALTEPADPAAPAPDAPLVIDDLDAARDYLHQDPPPDEESVLVYLDDVDDTERSAVAALLLHAEAEAAEPRSDLIDALAERAGGDANTGKRAKG